jgi:uncharacterized protein involved in outer membrane biogenesis
MDGDSGSPPEEVGNRHSRVREPSRFARVTMRVRIALGAALVLVVALLTHPWWLAHLIGDYLAKTSGRAVHFDSVRVGLSSSLSPIVVMRGVRIANAPWADTRRPFAAFEEAAFQFAWRRFENRWVVSHLVLRDGEVNLALQADGLRNWRLRDPEDRGPGHYWFFALEPRRASLSFVNAGIDLALNTRASDLAPEPAAAASEPLVNQIDFDGAFLGLAFKGSVATGAVLTFLETDRWFAVRGGGEVEGARLSLDGRAADIFRATQIDAQVAVNGSSLAALHPFVGRRYAEPRAFRGEGRLHADAGRYALSGARARIGGTDLAGDLAWWRQGERRAVKADLHSDSTDLADLSWLAGRGTLASAKVAALAPASAASAAHGVERDAFAAARELDADLSFDARRIHAAAVPALQSLKAKAVLADGALSIPAFDAGWAGGHFTGTLALDLRQHPARGEAMVETKGVRLESLFSKQDEKRRITGVLRGHMALKASGDSIEALRASVAGKVTATLSDGTIPSMLDALIGLEGGKVMRSLISGTEPLALPCAMATADVEQGKLHIRSLVVASANTRTTGAGTLDLRDATIDLALTPEPKRPGLFELNKSIHLSGKLAKPQRSLVDRLTPLAGAGCEDGKA